MKILYWIGGFLVLGVIILIGVVPYLSPPEEMKIAEIDYQRLAKIEAYEEPDSREIEYKSLITLAAGDNLTLTMDPYTDSTATELKLYYDVIELNENCVDPPDYPNNYNGTGLTEGDSPIVYVIDVDVDPSNVSIDLTGLTIGKKYCFATTASNGQAESAYSNVAPNTPEITSPEPGSTLTGDFQEFTWKANGMVVTAWWMYVGSAGGMRDYCDSGDLGTTTSYTCSNLPTDGSTIYVTLWYFLNGWYYEPHQYTACSGACDSMPEITSPAPDSTLTGSSEEFTWRDNGSNVTEWWLYVGSAEETYDYCDSGNLSTTTSYSCNNLPTDGSTIHVTLLYKLDGDWNTEPYQYTAYDADVGGTPEITSPTPGSTLTGSSEEFTWTDNGADVTGWWLYVGSAEEAYDYCDSGNLDTTTSYTCNNLPTDGSTIYVTLFYMLNGDWNTEPYQYTAFE